MLHPSGSCILERFRPHDTQHVLSPTHTLEEAKLVDGQLILLEMSLQDGAWPRSQMQSMLEAEEEEAQAGTASSLSLFRVRSCAEISRTNVDYA